MPASKPDLSKAFNIFRPVNQRILADPTLAQNEEYRGKIRKALEESPLSKPDFSEAFNIFRPVYQRILADPTLAQNEEYRGKIRKALEGSGLSKPGVDIPEDLKGLFSWANKAKTDEPSKPTLAKKDKPSKPDFSEAFNIFRPIYQRILEDPTLAQNEEYRDKIRRTLEGSELTKPGIDIPEDLKGLFSWAFQGKNDEPSKPTFNSSQPVSGGILGEYDLPRDEITGEYADPSAYARNVAIQAAHQLGNRDYQPNPYEKWIAPNSNMVESENQLLSALKGTPEERALDSKANKNYDESENSAFSDYSKSQLRSLESDPENEKFVKRKHAQLYNALQKRLKERFDDQDRALVQQYSGQNQEPGGYYYYMKRKLAEKQQELLKDLDESTLMQAEEIGRASHDSKFNRAAASGDRARSEAEHKLRKFALAKDEKRNLRAQQFENINLLHNLGVKRREEQMAENQFNASKVKERQEFPKTQLRDFTNTIATISPPIGQGYSPDRFHGVNPSSAANIAPIQMQSLIPPQPSNTMGSLIGTAMQGYGTYKKMQENDLNQEYLKAKTDALKRGIPG